MRSNNKHTDELQWESINTALLGVGGTNTSNEQDEEQFEERRKAYGKYIRRRCVCTQDLWGEDRAYIDQPEDKAGILGMLYYTWVGDFMFQAAREEVRREAIPQPTRHLRSYCTGKKLSQAAQEQWYYRHIWDPYRGATVRLRQDVESRGTLLWVGHLQQRKATELVVGIDWERPPEHRATEGGADATRSPFHNGVVDGERLFETMGGKDTATCEKLTDVVFITSSGKPLPPPMKPESMSIAWAMISSLGYHMWIQAPAKLLSDACTLAAPVVLEQFIKWLSNDGRTWRGGLMLVALIFFVQAIQSCAQNKYNHLSMRGGQVFKSALTALLFEKCFHISSKSLAHPDMGTGRIVNMVSTDVDRARQFSSTVMLAWSAPLQLLVAVVLLYRLVGWSAFIGLAVLLLFMPLQGTLVKYVYASYHNKAKATDVRVKETNEFFSSIRIAKFMTWEPRFIASIENKRRIEIGHLKRLQYLSMVIYFFTAAAPTLVIAVVFAVYSALGNELTPAIVFPTIAVLNIIRMPFIMIPVILTAFMQFLVSMRRIAKFVECEETIEALQGLELILNGITQKEGRSAVTENGAKSRANTDDASLKGVTLKAYHPEKLPNREDEPKLKGRLAQCLRRRRERIQQAAGSTTQAKKTPQNQVEFYELVGKTILTNVSITIPKGKLTIVIGATGSGKSTLLHALLGELEVSQGTVWATSSIAYVPQQAWIMNATLRDNVLFFSDADEARFERALDVCQLRPDLALLADGVRTEIGEKGINLSGGQKARVSLARAVYADRDMYLLDDPLSALDAHVGERVMKDCILGELAGKTRVLATHQVHFLSAADYIIALGSDGIVLFCGSYQSYSETGKESASVVTHDCNYIKEQSLEELNGSTETSRVSLGDDNRKPASEKGKLTTIEEKATGSVSVATHMAYLRAAGGMCKVVSFLLLVASTEVMNVAGTVWLSIWSVRAVPTLGTTQYLYIYVGLVAAGTLTTPIRYLFAFKMFRSASRAMHQGLLRSVGIATMEFFDTTPLGRVLNRFTRDMDQLDGEIPESYTYLVISSASIISSLTIITFAQPLVLLALIPCALVYYKLMLFYKAASRELRRLGNISQSPVVTMFTETLTGRLTIAAFKQTRTVMQQSYVKIDSVYAASYMQMVCDRWLAVRIEFLSCIVITSIALAGVLGSMCNVLRSNVGLVAMSLTMSMSITWLLNWTIRLVASLEANMNSVERILYYTQNIAHEDIKDIDACVSSYNARAIADGGTGVNTATAAAQVTIEATGQQQQQQQQVRTAKVGTVVAGSLEFRGVQLRYREGLPLVLKDVSFSIKPREKVGVVGRTGSGKSTLLLTFMRLVEICGGEMVVSGRAAQSYGLRELRQLFSMIPQDPVLFDGTVRTNLDPFHEASADDVWHALELVGMRERVASESSGVDSRVLEGGSNYSVGQRQLLCLARALLKRGSGFILMDEATANIDQALDKQIQRTVMTAFADYTVITIAHRLHTVAHYDTIIVMDHGQVAEIGSPRALVQSPTSAFRSMVESMGTGALNDFVDVYQSE